MILGRGYNDDVEAVQLLQFPGQISFTPSPSSTPSVTQTVGVFAMTQTGITREVVEDLFGRGIGQGSHGGQGLKRLGQEGKLAGSS